MFDDFERYAVYWVPRRPDPLGPFGDAWTGWSAESGEHHPRSAFPGLPAVTGELARHGLHGVIRAPFRLQPGRSRFAVEHALDEIAEETVAFRLPRLALAVVEGRVALAPAHSSGPLAALVTRVTEALAPLADPEPAAGHVNGFAEAPAPAIGDAPVVTLAPTAAQRFHLPLTDPRPLEEAHALKDALAALVGPLLATPRFLSEIALMGDPGGGRPLRVLQGYRLLDWPLRPGARALPSHGPQVLAPMPEGRRKADAAY